MSEYREGIAALAEPTCELRRSIRDVWAGFSALHQAAVAMAPPLADKTLRPRKHGLLIPGAQSHAMRIAFEKYFFWKARHGYVNLS